MLSIKRHRAGFSLHTPSPLGVSTPSLTYTTIVESGAPAPGTGGATFSALEGSPVINDSGRVDILGSLTGNGVTPANNEGFWSYASGTGSLLARKGDQAPGTTGTFAGFNVPGLANNGTSAFFSGTGQANGGWVNKGGIVAPVAVTGQPAPGVVNGTYEDTFPDFPSFHYPIAMNASGNVAFASPLDGVPADVADGVWAGAAGEVQLVLQAGQPAPGTSSNFVPGFSQVVLNDSGALAFRGACGNGDGIWSGKPGAVQLVALQGQSTGSGGTFTDFDEPTINSTGGIAFAANLSSAIYHVTSSGSVEQVVVAGQPVPGIPGATFQQAFTTPALNGLGAMAFAASYYGSGPGSGIFLSNVLGLHAIATSGQVAPGTNGQTFTAFPFAPSLNVLGQVSFFAFTSNGSIGLWITSLTGTLLCIALQGAPFATGSGPRTIGQIQANGATGGEEGMPRNLNATGAFAFRLDFTDGSSGLYLATGR